MTDSQKAALNEDTKKHIKGRLKRIVQVARVAEVTFKAVGVMYSNKTLQKGIDLIIDGFMETDTSELEKELTVLKKLKAADEGDSEEES